MNLLAQLGIQHPVFLAPMAGVTTPELAAAVSNAGGLGALGLGASSVEAAKAAILKTKQLTDKPFQVNFFCHQPTVLDQQDSHNWITYVEKQFAKYDAKPPLQLNKIYDSFLENAAFFDLLLETRPKAVSFHFGLPPQAQISALKAAGMMTMASVTQLSEATAAKAAGIDVLIAQGIEAGGHRGTFNPVCDPAMPTKELVKLLLQQMNLPVVAAGGIMNGRDIADYLALGASATQLGTAFIPCRESAANDAYRKALFEQTATQITDSISGRPARGLFNHWHQVVDLPDRPKTPGYPYTYDLGKQLHAVASKKGEHGFGAFWAGSNVSQVRALDAKPLMQTLVQEMTQASSN